jgi:hypothetical protein
MSSSVIDKSASLTKTLIPSLLTNPWSTSSLQSTRPYLRRRQHRERGSIHDGSR